MVGFELANDVEEGLEIRPDLVRVVDLALEAVVGDAIVEKVLVRVDSAGPDDSGGDFGFGGHSSEDQVAAHTVAPEAGLVWINLVELLKTSVGIENIADVVAAKVGA